MAATNEVKRRNSMIPFLRATAEMRKDYALAPQPVFQIIAARMRLRSRGEQLQPVGLTPVRRTCLWDGISKRFASGSHFRTSRHEKKAWPLRRGTVTPPCYSL